MAFLFLFFTVALSLCVAGLIIIALAAILGTVRDDWKLKKTEKNERELPPRDR
jgi:MFS-type transporter involved in bile tolerance (Atg22 family)